MDVRVIGININLHDSSSISLGSFIKVLKLIIDCLKLDGDYEKMGFIQSYWERGLLKARAIKNIRSKKTIDVESIAIDKICDECTGIWWESYKEKSMFHISIGNLFKYDGTYLGSNVHIIDYRLIITYDDAYNISNIIKDYFGLNKKIVINQVLDESKQLDYCISYE